MAFADDVKDILPIFRAKPAIDQNRKIAASRDGVDTIRHRVFSHDAKHEWVIIRKVSQIRSVL